MLQDIRRDDQGRPHRAGGVRRRPGAEESHGLAELCRHRRRRLGPGGARRLPGRRLSRSCAEEQLGGHLVQQAVPRVCSAAYCVSKIIPS